MAPLPPRFSWTIFLTLGVILVASLMMFLLLVRRWTTQRQWVSLAEWAKERRFQFRSTDPNELPAVLQPLRVSNVQIRLHLCSEGTTLAQLSTDPPAGKLEPNVWNVLVARRSGVATNPAGLRPATA